MHAKLLLHYLCVGFSILLLLNKLLCKIYFLTNSYNFEMSSIYIWEYLPTISSRGQWMDYMCRLGISSTSSGSSDLRGAVSARDSVRLSGLLFLSWLLYFLLFSHFSAAFFLRFFQDFVLFKSCCSHSQVFIRTLVRECHIFYSHSKWSSCFRCAKTAVSSQSTILVK